MEFQLTAFRKYIKCPFINKKIKFFRNLLYFTARIHQTTKT